jgi:hypothetical protein
MQLEQLAKICSDHRLTGASGLIDTWCQCCFAEISPSIAISFVATAHRHRVTVQLYMETLLSIDLLAADRQSKTSERVIINRSG